MGTIAYDPDEWETVPAKGDGSGFTAWGQRRRSPEQTAAIKAEKQRLHEERILAEADAIRKARAEAETA